MVVLYANTSFVFILHSKLKFITYTHIIAKTEELLAPATQTSGASLAAGQTIRVTFGANIIICLIFELFFFAETFALV